MSLELPNELKDIIELNKDKTNELSLLYIQYFSFKKNIDENSLKLFSSSINPKNSEKLLRIIKEFQISLKDKIEAYREFINLYIQRNILKAKTNQYNLEKREKVKTQHELEQKESKLSSFNFDIFELKDIYDLSTFINLLIKTEPMFLDEYRKQSSFFNNEMAIKINSSQRLYSQSSKDMQKLVSEFNLENFEFMQTDITSLLEEKLLKSLLSSFKANTEESCDDFFSLVKKVHNATTSKYLKLSRGLSFV